MYISVVFSQLTVLFDTIVDAHLYIRESLVYEKDLIIDFLNFSVQLYS